MAGRVVALVIGLRGWRVLRWRSRVRIVGLRVVVFVRRHDSRRSARWQLWDGSPGKNATPDGLLEA